MLQQQVILSWKVMARYWKEAMEENFLKKSKVTKYFPFHKYKTCTYVLFLRLVGIYRHAQFHITTPQPVISIMYFSPTLRPISAPLAEGVH